jgi:type 1 glutamine amidotransferase
VLVSIDESTYEGGTMGKDHPMTWTHTFEGGRVWYTALGHTESSFAEPEFLKHLLGAIEFAAGVKQADVTPLPRLRAPGNLRLY